ncbi:hypothetical protein PN36_27525 [Candidatus Thiomargarita nelsonii]|uniref:Uncharacterized protein n=1 Tax=Candidatus Thiomargarita nelsonii TaxID=1003181 RepID=A0A0A6P8V9_9GAMM|nr:hypothetical protein PN36_27525 [Candidatus Thiomargarita nelsonii]
MNMEIDDELNDELRDEYDFSQMKGGVRGKYANQYQNDVKLIMLEPDIVKIFPDAKSVNTALRSLAKIIQQHQKFA